MTSMVQLERARIAINRLLVVRETAFNYQLQNALHEILNCITEQKPTPRDDERTEPLVFVRFLGVGSGFEGTGIPPFFEPTHDLGGEDRPYKR